VEVGGPLEPLGNVIHITMHASTVILTLLEFKTHAEMEGDEILEVKRE
jgi:hypothetical protein